MRNTGTPGIGRVLTIATFALSCFGLLLFLWIAFGGSSPLKPKGYRIEASFADATTLALQADVRISGVPVGKVIDKRRDPAGNRSIATLEMEPRYAPLPEDTKAILRQKTLLGETYVELTPGSKGADEIEEGGRLRNVRVQPTVEFDELLRIFDADTRDAFRAWQRSSVKAFEGEGDRANAVFGNLPGFVENAQSVVDVLNRRREALTQLIRGTGDTFEALTRNEAALRGLITSNRAALEALAAKRESLAESFRIFPTFLRESRATLNRLETFSGETTPLVRDLEPVLRDAAPTLASLRRLAPDLENLFVEFRPLIAAGEQGLPAMGRIFRGMAPTLKELGPLLQQLNPVLEMLELYQTTVSDFLNTGPTALANTLAKQPGTNGHALPQVIVLGSDTLPQTRRSAANRGNAYIPPDGYNDRTGPFVRPDRFILPTWDCANAGGEKPPTDRNPGCELSDKIPFQGRLQKFPQVHPSGAGGVSTQPGRGATPAR